MIYDRYLIARYTHVFVISFIALFGLFVIFHAFSNADEFMSPGKGALAVVQEMAIFYLFRFSQFFDMVAGTVGVIAAMVVFTLVQRHGELNPILSAGVPTYRLVWPLVAATVFVNVLLVANQEFIIPQIANQLQVDPGQGRDVRCEVEPNYDFATHIIISAKELHLREQKLGKAEFVLPVNQIVADRMTTVKAVSAQFFPATNERPNGWVLSECSIPFSSLKLTPEGQKLILPGKQPDEIFVATDVSFDRLYRSDKSYQYLSSMELRRRLRNPSSSTVSIRRQAQYLHTRFTQPLINVIVVLLGVPIVARKESRGLIMNLAMCAGAMSSVFGINQLFQYLGSASLVAADLAAWAPVIICGTCSAWVSGLVRS